jgi:hypothetical protein
MVLLEKQTSRNSRFEDFIKRIQYNFENNNHKEIYADILNFRHKELF